MIGVGPRDSGGKVNININTSTPRPLLNTCRLHRGTLPPEGSRSRELSFLGPIEAWNLHSSLFPGKTDERPSFQGYLLRPAVIALRKALGRWPGPRW